MTGSPEISNFEIWTPETALFQTMTRQSTHQTPMNQNPTSWIFRSDFDEANGLDLSSRNSRHHRPSIVRTNVSSTPTSPGVVSIDSGMSKLVEVNVLQRLEAPVKRKPFFSDETSFFDDNETENSIFSSATQPELLKRSGNLYSDEKSLETNLFVSRTSLLTKKLIDKFWQNFSD